MKSPKLTAGLLLMLLPALGSTSEPNGVPHKTFEAASRIMGVIENTTRDYTVYFTLSGVPEYTLDASRKRRFDVRQQHRLAPGESLPYYVSTFSTPPASIEILGGQRSAPTRARRHIRFRHPLLPGRGYALVEEGSSIEGEWFVIAEMKPGGSKPTAGTLGVVSLRNPTEVTIEYRLRWSQERPWQNYTVRPRGRIWHWSGHASNPQISFDHSPKPGYQGHTGLLRVNVFSGVGDPGFRDGKQYAFQRTANGLTLRSERPVLASSVICPNQDQQDTTKPRQAKEL